MVGKMLIDPALNQGNAFGIDLLHTQRRHARERVIRFHAQSQHVITAIARDTLRTVRSLRAKATRVAKQRLHRPLRTLRGGINLLRE